MGFSHKNDAQMTKTNPPVDPTQSYLLEEDLNVLSELTLDRDSLHDSLKHELPDGEVSARIWRDEHLRLRISLHGTS